MMEIYQSLKTGKNNSSFKNEVVFEFEEVESIIVIYATRQDSAKVKDFQLNSKFMVL
ncbi:MAG: hypothetical protein ACLRQX_07110 [Turicibacter sanguinis]